MLEGAHKRAVDGLEVLEALPAGGGPATPILFVHGAFTAAWCWAEHFLPYFAQQGFPAYAISLRGHGGSRGRERLFTFGIADYVEDVSAAVRAIGRPCVLVGHSMGGFVVQKCLEEEHAPAAVLMASVPPQGLFASQVNLALTNPSLFAEMNSVLSHGRGSADAMRKALFAGPVASDKLRDYFHRTQAESQRAIWDMTLFSLPRPWAMHKPPLLCLAAERDALFPLEQQRVGASMLGCALEVLPDLGHAIMLEAGWQKAADRIVGWLRARGL